MVEQRAQKEGSKKGSRLPLQVNRDGPQGDDWGRKMVDSSRQIQVEMGSETMVHA